MKSTKRWTDKTKKNAQSDSTVLKRVVVVYAAGNTTAVLFGESGSELKKLNSQITQAWKRLKPKQPEIEQCCFVVLPRNPVAVARVKMFGGEFCGNAARGVAWLVTKRQRCRGLIEVSGVNHPLEFSIRDNQVAVEMPLPKLGRLVRPVAEGLLVQFDGITQLVVNKPKDNQTPRQLLMMLRDSNKHNLANQLTVGVTYYDQNSNQATFCVWVKEVDTIFDETACGSGTAAIGIGMAIEAKCSVSLNVVQPSGASIHTEAEYADGVVARSLISGKVAVLYDGELKL